MHALVQLMCAGSGLIKLNGAPIELVQPDTLRTKLFEPIILLGKERFANVDIRVRVKGGGQVSQIYGPCNSSLHCHCGQI